MPAKVTLTVSKGQLQGQAFVYADRTTCIMGRADDCSPQLPNDEAHKTISRHHCLLDINPPDVRVRDFGSLNGTFVNGTKIGQREQGMTPEQGARMTFPEHDLNEGDQIELGNTVFQVRVFVPAVCAGCAAEIPEAEKAQAEQAPGVYQCPVCRRKAAEAPGEPSLAQVSMMLKVCAQCGKDVSGEVGPNRNGHFICAECKADPSRIVEHLLELSQAGDKDLLAIKGYRILKELGRGGMGAVYLAQHSGTGERVALKIMLPQIAADAHAQQLFLREVNNTKALQHPNVVRLHDAGCAQGTFFFTLDYCDGGSVDQLLRGRRQPLPLEEALAIILQALDGLEYAHNVFGPGNGLVHRDLKPPNLFLSGSGTARVVRLGDFGMGKAFDEAGLSGLTRSGTVMGTPAFMPRQQVINFKYAKPEVDVWAMAATLYFMLTGQRPREFPRDRDWWQMVLQTSAVPIRQRNPRVPQKLAAVIDHALVDKPAIPFKSAAEFKRGLESVL